MSRVLYSQGPYVDDSPQWLLGRSLSLKITNACKANMNRFLTKKKAKRAQPEPKFELDLSTALPSSNEFRTSLLMPNLSARFSMLREQDDPNSKLGKASDDSVLAPKRQSRLYDFGFKPTGLSDIAEVASITSSIRPPFAAERSNSYSSDMGYNTDGEGDGSGVMSRSRPGEGNVLFGGRQKITRIAGDGKGRTLYDDDVSTSTFQKWRAEERQREREAALAAGGRKFSFEDEGKSPSKPGSYATSVAGSLKRQTSSSTSASGMDSRSSTAATSITSQGPPSASMSPAAGLSSFNFGPSVTNAAPTSPSAQPKPNPVPAPVVAMDRSATKRRLYDQGLDRELQDQQTNAISRLQSMTKRPGLSGGRSTPDLFQSRNGFAAAENPMRNGMAQLRSTSPSPVSPIERRPTVNGLPGKDVKIGRSNTGKSVVLPVATLPNDGRQEVLASALNPNDRGKATAMGVFNKPKQFSEQQFLERQMSLRMGRETPTPTSREIDAIAESPIESEDSKDEVETLPAAPVSMPTSVPPHLRNAVPAPLLNNAPTSVPTSVPVAVSKPTPAGWDQSRSVSNGPFNRSLSPSEKESNEPPAAPSAFSVFQKAANQMKTQERKDSPQMPQKNKFTFIDDSDSEYEEERPAPPVQPARHTRLPLNTRIPDDAPLVAPPQHEHPAFRNTTQPSREDLRVDVRKPSLDTDQAPTQNKPVGADVDSPTLPSASANGLSGMIRHLRDVSAASNYSVVTAPTTPAVAPPTALQTRNLNHVAPNQNSAGAENTAHSSYSHSNPWDLEEFNGEIKNLATRDSASVLEDESSKDARAAEVSPIKPASKPEASQENSWQQELNKKTHNRGGSTETQHEREAFANELAMRQKAIQEKLRERAESDMRSASPAPGKPSGPFMGILRQKSSFDGFRSRDNSRTRDESRPRAESRTRGESRPRAESKSRAGDKAAKILGVNGSSVSLINHSPQLESTHEHPAWETERSNPPRSVPLSVPRPSKELQQAGYGQISNSNPVSRPGTGRDSSEDKVRSRSNSNAVSQRSRSNSEHSNGRSRSRNGRFRDDMTQAAAEATIPEDLPPQPPAPEHPIPEIPESPSHSNGLREYKAVDAATFEQKGLWPPPQNPIVHPLGIPSPRPSPGLSPGFAPNGSALSPGLNVPSPRPSPGLSPGLSPGFGPMSPSIFSSGRGTPVAAFANPTPPMSSSSTPTASSFSASTPNLLGGPGTKAARQRKMSIKKTDIGDPILISTTSVVDTVDLPVGASLRNGMDAPPVPPFNPRRKRFGFGRAETEPPEPPFASPMFGSGSHSSDESQKPRAPRNRLKKSSSDGAKIGLYIRAQQEGIATQSTPALQHMQTSPPRMQNGMF